MRTWEVAIIYLLRLIYWTHANASIHLLIPLWVFLFILTGWHKGQPYTKDSKVKNFIQWIKTQKEDSYLEKTTMGGYYPFPPIPDTFSKYCEKMKGTEFHCAPSIILTVLLFGKVDISWQLCIFQVEIWNFHWIHGLNVAAVLFCASLSPCDWLNLLNFEGREGMSEAVLWHYRLYCGFISDFKLNWQ